MTLRRATITSIGRSLPDKILSNHDLEAMVDTTDAWILARTGIRERRIVEKGFLDGDTGPPDLRVKSGQAGGIPSDDEGVPEED